MRRLLTMSLAFAMAAGLSCSAPTPDDIETLPSVELHTPPSTGTRTSHLPTTEVEVLATPSPDCQFGNFAHLISDGSALATPGGDGSVGVRAGQRYLISGRRTGWTWIDNETQTWAYRPGPCIKDSLLIVVRTRLSEAEIRRLRDRRRTFGEGAEMCPTPYGYWTHRRRDGREESSSEVRDDEMQGHWTFWRHDGQRLVEGEYLDGKPHGRWVVWRASGQKRGEYEWRDGTPHGPAIRWHPNGRKSGEGEYRKGKPHGPWIYWHENGQKRSEGVHVDGKESGAWRDWFANGQKWRETTFDGGLRVGLERRWHENGQLAFEGTFVEGRISGHTRRWTNEGVMWQSMGTRDGRKDGHETRWHANGEKAWEGENRDGRRIGPWTEWHENGQLGSSGAYRDGAKSGIWRYWHANGQLAVLVDCVVSGVTRPECWSEAAQPVACESLRASLSFCGHWWLPLGG